jgi:hypothetical protein
MCCHLAVCTPDNYLIGFHIILTLFPCHTNPSATQIWLWCPRVQSLELKSGTHLLPPRFSSVCNGDANPVTRTETLRLESIFLNIAFFYIGLHDIEFCLVLTQFSSRVISLNTARNTTRSIKRKIMNDYELIHAKHLCGQIKTCIIERAKWVVQNQELSVGQKGDKLTWWIKRDIIKHSFQQNGTHNVTTGLLKEMQLMLILFVLR